jgi:uncharacterized protein with ParB-like and HNH nuclease domain
MNRSSSSGTPEYFLGTIVLVDSKDGKPPSISDGQQRLATGNGNPFRANREFIKLTMTLCCDIVKYMQSRSRGA